MPMAGSAVMVLRCIEAPKDSKGSGAISSPCRKRCGCRESKLRRIVIRRPM